MPDPTSYNPNWTQARSTDPKWGFGTGARKPLTDGKNCSPSMQAYNIPSRAIEGRAQHMGAKLSGSKASLGPGPGSYDPNW